MAPIIAAEAASFGTSLLGHAGQGGPSLWAGFSTSIHGWDRLLTTVLVVVLSLRANSSRIILGFAAVYGVAVWLGATGKLIFLLREPAILACLLGLAMLALINPRSKAPLTHVVVAAAGFANGNAVGLGRDVHGDVIGYTIGAVLLIGLCGAGVVLIERTSQEASTKPLGTRHSLGIRLKSWATKPTEKEKVQ